MDAALAGRLTEDWVTAHVAIPPPSPEAAEAVKAALAMVPEPDAAAVVTAAGGSPRVAALAGGALYVVWSVPGAIGVREGARCRRLPLAPASTAVEVSQRRDPDGPVRHWSFEVDDEPLVFRTTGDGDAERFARALAGALGWPH